MPTLSNWQTRNKKGPQQEDVERTILGGIHLVPLSQKGDKTELTWRISFSKAEVELSQLISEVACTCFVALKIIIKDYLSVNCRHQNSCHLKTMLLRHIEETGLVFWCEKNLKELLSYLVVWRLQLKNRAVHFFGFLISKRSQRHAGKIYRAFNWRRRRKKSKRNRNKISVLQCFIFKYDSITHMFAWTYNSVWYFNIITLLLYYWAYVPINNTFWEILLRLL